MGGSSEKSSSPAAAAARELAPSYEGTKPPAVLEVRPDGSVRTYARGRVRIPKRGPPAPRAPELVVSGAPLDPVRDVIKKNPVGDGRIVRDVLDPLLDLINRAPKLVVIGALVYWLAPGVLAGVIARPRRRRR